MLLVLTAELVITLALRLAVGPPPEVQRMSANAVAPLVVPAAPSAVACAPDDVPAAYVRLCARL